MFQYHYNFLSPKIRNIALQFHFLRNKIYSVCVNAKPSLKWWIFENLQLVASIEQRDFWSCVVYWSEIALCFLALNSVGSWFNYFLRSRNQSTGVLFKNLIVKMQNIYNSIGWNSVHIFDIFNCDCATINGM